MAAPRAGLNPTTLSVGFTAKLVTVTAISPDGASAVCVDRQNTQTTVNMLVQRSKGPLPKQGETWLLAQDLGAWTFAAFVATAAGQFTEGSGAGGGHQITVAAQAPADPSAGDIWVNGAAGNAVFTWTGGGWLSLQFGTQALADKSVTAAKIADGTITSAQIAPDAGITAGQVAFTVSEIGGSRVWTSAQPPPDPQSGDIWINPDQGNMVSAWNGATWIVIQFGAAAIQPGSLTSQQLSSSAGIGSAQVEFTARDIGGITTTVSASEPSDPQPSDLWYDANSDYALNEWNGTAWIPYQFGTQAIAAGSVTAALIAANTITAAQIAAGTITAAQIAAGTITAKNLAVGGAVNANPYFSGGDLTGWAGYNGTIEAVRAPGSPYPWALQLTPDGTGSTPAAEGSPSAFPVIPGAFYLVSAVVNAVGTVVEIGFDWNSATGYLSTSASNVTVTAGEWTVISSIQQVPAGAVSGYARVGLTGTPPQTSVLLAEAITVLTPINGGVIEAGTVTADHIAAGTVAAGIVNGTDIIGAEFIGDGTGLEFVLYAGPPAADNVVLSSSTQALTDSYGNNILQGTAVYSGPSATVLTPTGGVTWYINGSGTGQTGTWSVAGTFDMGTVGYPTLNPGVLMLTGVVEASLVGSSIEQQVALWASQNTMAVNIGSVSGGGEAAALIGGAIVIGSSDTSTHSVPSSSTATVTVTEAYLIGFDTSFNGVPGDVYELTTEFSGTWPLERLDVYCVFNGTATKLGTIGATFASGTAAGDTVNGWLRLTARVLTTTSVKVSLQGVIQDGSLNSDVINYNYISPVAGPPTTFTLRTGAASIGNNGPNTIAIGLAWETANSGYSITTDGSHCLRLPG